ncbi:MAG TPA: hypothetical protein VJT15_04980 [Pyrinomonadaceae bacterium]|nr:hypothetical protein [Pyrinomonadaceae bacterium]
MPNDTTLQSVFDYAKQGPLNTGGGPPTLPAIYATLVEHHPNSHPPGGSNTADLVAYANGPMTLSADQKKLSGELKRWRNIHDPGLPAFFETPPQPEDAFADLPSKQTVVVTVSDTGQVTYELRLNGTFGYPQPLVVTYENGLFVEKTAGVIRTLSFTLGTTH